MVTSLRLPLDEPTTIESQPTQDRKLHRNLLAPINLILTYSLGTYGLFILGPWDYPMAHNPWLALAVGIFNLTIYAGFRAGALYKTQPGSARTTLGRSTSLNRRVDRSVSVDNLMTIAFIVTAITFPLRLVIGTQNYGLDPGLFVDKVISGLSDARVTYSERAATQPPGLWAYVNYFVVLTGFVSWLYTPMAILLWHRIGWLKRCLAIVVCIGMILLSAARGQNFAAFDVLTQVAAFVLIRSLMKARTQPPRQLSSKFKAISSFGLMLIAMTSFFANTMRSRVGDQYAEFYVSGNLVPLKESNFLWDIIPPFLQPPFATLSIYLTHAYSALALAIGLPFDSTYGFGSSYFLMDNLESATGVELFERSYQYKLALSSAYDTHGLWHTAYLWIANDVSIIGVPVVLFGLFFVFGRAWRDFLTTANFMAGLLMAPMAVFVAFISASNQITAQPNALFAFWTVLLLWARPSRQYEWDPPGQAGPTQIHNE